MRIDSLGKRVFSCGCYHKEKITTHGETIGYRTRLYGIWRGIIERCEDENSEHYINYGKRGIKLCKEWRGSYIVFRDWATSNEYADNLTIDRIDVNGSYEPNNCRWATSKVQANNRRNNVIIVFNGMSRTIAEWEDYFGWGRERLRNRLRAGWSIEKAMTTPLRKIGKRKEA
jgi:hypothetical protein